MQQLDSKCFQNDKIDINFVTYFKGQHDIPNLGSEFSLMGYNEVEFEKWSIPQINRNEVQKPQIYLISDREILFSHFDYTKPLELTNFLSDCEICHK